MANVKEVVTNGSVCAMHRTLRRIFGRHNRQVESVTVNRLRTMLTLVNNAHPKRRHTVRTENATADPNETICHHAQ